MRLAGWVWAMTCLVACDAVAPRDRAIREDASPGSESDAPASTDPRAATAPDGPPTLEVHGEPDCTRAGEAGTFELVNAAVGVTFEHTDYVKTSFGFEGLVQRGGGVAVEDFDGDGALDLYFTNNGGPDEIYLTGGRGPMRYESRRLAVDGKAFHLGAFVADPDRDGDIDILLTPVGGGAGLLVNDGTGHFTPRPRVYSWGFPSLEGAASWGDINGDGQLDLVVAGGPVGAAGPGSTEPGGPDRVLLGAGSLQFTDGSFPLSDPEGAAFLAALLDYDNDGDLDVYVVNDHGQAVWPNRLLRNDGAGGLVDVSEESGAGLAMDGMGLAVADIDGNGWLDLYVSHMFPYSDELLLNEGGTFRRAVDEWGANTVAVPGRIAWGTIFIDADSDGREDLFVAHGSSFGYLGDGFDVAADQPNVLLRHRGDHFEDVSAAAGVDGGASSRSVVEADLDHDGFPDLVVGNLDAAPYVLMNHCDAARAWVGVRLRSRTSSAMGARITVEAGGRRHLRELGSGNDGLYGSGPSEVVVGLGDATRVDRVTVRWPDGRTHQFDDLPVRRWISVLDGVSSP